MEKETTMECLPAADRQLRTDGEKLHVQISTLNTPSRDQSELQENGQYVTGLKLAIVMVSMTMVFFLVMLDLSIIATVSHASSRWPRLLNPTYHPLQAIPRITSDFHSLPDVGWYGSAYLFAKCVPQSPAETFSFTLN